MPDDFQTRTLRVLCFSGLPLLAAACSAGPVDLGEVSGDLRSAPSRCQDSTLVEGSVLVENQAQLDELAGCETIAGNLRIRPFEGADFRPLGALKVVRGELHVGRLSILDTFDLPPELFEQLDQIMEREQALLTAGWITSLEGFENLERAGSLWLSGIGASSLEPLSKLSTLSGSGILQLDNCTNLRDLTGLRSLAGVSELTVNCHSLESLAGPAFSTRMGEVLIIGSETFDPDSVAHLADLGSFAPELVNGLRIEGTALENLDALSNLVTAGDIDLWDNRLLSNADGLDTLSFVRSLRIAYSPALVRLPELTSMFQLDQLIILLNDALENFPSLPNVSQYADGDTSWGNRAPENAVDIRPDLVDISGNPSLQQVVLPPGWLAASYVTIAGNEKLTHVSLGSLHAADSLIIGGNPLLESVDLGLLETVDDLRIIDNPLLPLEPFDGIRTFERLVQPGPLTEEQYGLFD